MVNFIELNECDRKTLFQTLKEVLKTPWKQLYETLGISKAMFFNYLSGKYAIPETIFIKIEKKSGLKIKNFKRIFKPSYSPKKIKNPKMTKFLAEALGILNGDGHMNQINYQICVVGNLLETEYFAHMQKLFEKVFFIPFNLRKEKNKFRLLTYSKDLVFLLHDRYGVPIGKKLGSLRIPKKFFNKKILLSSYLRGLFDTDGTIYKRRKKDLVVEITSYDGRFLKEIKHALNLFGLHPGISGTNLYLYKRVEIDRFFNVIKPANSKHLKRYMQFGN